MTIFAGVSCAHPGTSLARASAMSEKTPLVLWDRHGQPIAVGRLPLNSEVDAQIRYMPVETVWHDSARGSQILTG